MSVEDRDFIVAIVMPFHIIIGVLQECSYDEGSKKL